MGSRSEWWYVTIPVGLYDYWTITGNWKAMFPLHLIYSFLDTLWRSYLHIKSSLRRSLSRRTTHCSFPNPYQSNWCCGQWFSKNLFLLEIWFFLFSYLGWPKTYSIASQLESRYDYSSSIERNSREHDSQRECEIVSTTWRSTLSISVMINKNKRLSFSFFFLFNFPSEKKRKSLLVQSYLLWYLFFFLVYVLSWILRVWFFFYPISAKIEVICSRQ